MNVSIPDCFMTAFIAGLIFGLVYEVIRIVRLILKFRVAVFACDVVFFILAAMFVCKLSEFLGNYVRLYTVLGFGAGVFTYIVTLGRLFNVLESAACVAWRKTLGRLFYKIGALVRTIVHKFSRGFKWVFVKIDQYSDKMAKKRLERLHLQDEKMYNNNINTDKVGEGINAHVIKATVRKSS